MKVNLYESSTAMQGGFTIPGMTLTGPLLLSGKVSSPLEAIHKQYVDTAVTNLDAANFVSGTLATARLPALAGDVTSNPNSNVVVLNVSGVIAGDYTKVTVDAKGRITTGLSLTEADLPNFSWTKLSSNLPNSLAGYGILDGVSTVNGVITGNLTLAANPVAPNEAATKTYADSNSSGGAKIVTGDIVSLVTSATPAGFVRCNGGAVSKTTYSALYAVVGDTFSGSNTLAGNGKPWCEQYDINSVQTGDITGWAATTSMPGPLVYSSAVVTKNRVYVLGGYGTSTYSSTVYTAPINSDGTIGAWTTGTALPVAMFDSVAIVVKNRVYLMGGSTSGGPTANVYVATINTDGTLGTWTATTSMAVALSGAQGFITTTRLYMLGGMLTGNSYASTVQYAPINADGSLGTWVVDTSLPIPLGVTRVALTKNRVYLFGGSTGSSSAMTYVYTIYTAPINTDGSLGAWTTAGTTPANMVYPNVMVTNKMVYLIGGSLGTGGYTAIVYKTTLNADGTLGTWTTGTSLPGIFCFSQVIATSSRVYLLSGFNGGYVATVYVANFSGGLNDYSTYYSGTITPADPAMFKLPDYSLYEKTSMYFYIKS